MSEEKSSFIREEGGKFNVYSHAGRRFGSYNTEAEANKRLREMEMFKSMKKEGSEMEKKALGNGVKAALIAAGMLGSGGAGYAVGAAHKKKKVAEAEKAGEFVGSVKTLEALGFGKEARETIVENVRQLAKDAAEKWIASAVPKSHKGLLHKKLGVPQGEKIPESKLKAAEKSGDSTLRHEAQFAENVKGLHKKAYDELVEKVAGMIKEALSINTVVSAASKRLAKLPAGSPAAKGLQNSIGSMVTGAGSAPGKVTASTKGLDVKSFLGNMKAAKIEAARINPAGASQVANRALAAQNNSLGGRIGNWVSQNKGKAIGAGVGFGAAVGLGAGMHMNKKKDGEL